MNRVRGLERVFYRAAGFVLPDLEPSARSRLELVSLIERLRRVGLPVAVACAVAGVSRASYYRWRYRLRRGGARALTDGRSRNRRRRAAPVRSAVRPLVEELRRERPMGKEKLALTLAAHGVTVSASTVGRCITELVSRGVVEAIGAARRGQRARRLAAARGWARRKRGEKPTQPGELVQLDTLQERTLGEPRYQFTAVDPVTRVAHAQLYKSLTSKSAREFLAELIPPCRSRCAACRSTTAASSRAPSRPPAPSWASPSTPSHHARLRPTPRSRGYTGPSATSTTPSNPPPSPSKSNGRP